MMDVSVLLGREGYANVSYTTSQTLLNLLPGTPSIARAPKKVLEDVVWGPQGPTEQATNISTGTQTRLSFQVGKAQTHSQRAFLKG